jgi:very-short-patch-repair endonuclease
MPRFDHDPASTSRARGLRRALTRYEVRLWLRLRGAQLGVSFRKQHPIGPYVVDFAAPSVHLVIEIDGGQHGTPGGRLADHKRDHFFASKGWEVMRFWNSDLFDNEDGVVETIWNRVQERLRLS